MDIKILVFAAMFWTLGTLTGLLIGRRIWRSQS
jgi:hypothetical protein